MNEIPGESGNLVTNNLYNLYDMCSHCCIVFFLCVV